MTQTPNVLIIHAHDMGRYNSAYGCDVSTPNIDRLKSLSVCFENAHCAAPTCSPSRAAMLTGETAHQSGMHGLLHRGFKLQNTSRHIAAWFGRHGYETTLAGIQHELLEDEIDDVYTHNIPRSDGPHANADLKAAHQTAEAIKNADSKPWLTWLGLFLPHRPFETADYSEDNLQNIQIPSCLPDTPEVRRDMADFFASVEITDQALGIVLDALEKDKLIKKTIIILTTDHGIPFPWMKCNLTSHGTGVTFMMHVPGIQPRHSQALVSHLDLFPTLCDLTAVSMPNWLLGNSLCPILNNTQAEVNNSIFAEVNCHAVADPMRAIRTSKYLMIRNYGHREGWAPANVDDSPTKTAVISRGDFSDKKLRPQTEFYIFEKDATESIDRFSEYEFSAELKSLDFLLDEWMKKTKDPLIEGHYTIPKGAILNKRKDLSPNDKIPVE